MLEVLIATVFTALLVSLSVRANRRYEDHLRLPMQWGFSGEVNWTAPRHIALAFTPVLGALMLGGTAALLVAGPPPRVGQEHLGVPVMLFQGMGLVGAHALHLWLIGRTVR